MMAILSSGGAIVEVVMEILLESDEVKGAKLKLCPSD
jgi:hypothetical protein